MYQDQSRITRSWTMADLVSIWRERCSHAKKTRVIKSLPIFTSLEKVEAQYLCSENGLMDMAFSKSENGPWTSLDDELYTLPIGVIMKQVWRWTISCFSGILKECITFDTCVFPSFKFFLFCPFLSRPKALYTSYAYATPVHTY